MSFRHMIIRCEHRSEWSIQLRHLHYMGNNWIVEVVLGYNVWQLTTGKFIRTDGVNAETGTIYD